MVPGRSSVRPIGNPADSGLLHVGALEEEAAPAYFGVVIRQKLSMTTPEWTTVLTRSPPSIVTSFADAQRGSITVVRG